MVPKPEMRLPKELTGSSVPSKIAVRPAPAPVVVQDGSTSVPEQKVLGALAWLASIGNAAPKKAAVAAIAGYSPTSGGFNNLCGGLRSKGLIEYPQNGLVSLTAEGSASAPQPEFNITSNEDLHRHILGRLSAPQGKVLEPILRAYPDALTKDQIAEAAGYSVSSGGFNNLMGSLRTLAFIDYPKPGTVRAEDILFPL
jgi:hypothetical protein